MGCDVTYDGDLAKARTFVIDVGFDKKLYIYDMYYPTHSTTRTITIYGDHCKAVLNVDVNFDSKTEKTVTIENFLGINLTEEAMLEVSKIAQLFSELINTPVTDPYQDITKMAIGEAEES